MGQSSMAGAGFSFINSLNTGHLKVLPFLFLLQLVILVNIYLSHLAYP